ncbi:MAG: hypothetical protein ACRDGD_12835 [Candidatus Limnocylindria bacterium]
MDGRRETGGRFTSVAISQAQALTLPWAAIGRHRSAIDVASVGDPHDQHCQAVILDLIEDPIVTDACPPDIVRAAKPDRSWAAWLVRQPVDLTHHSALHGRLETHELPRGRFEELDGIHGGSIGLL